MIGASIPTSGVHTVDFNATICQDLGFDAFNGTHCYAEGTSEWTTAPANGVFESFEDLYNYLDPDRRVRLMDVLHQYHKQGDSTSSFLSGNWYLYIVLLVFVVLCIEVFWQVWTYDADRRSSSRRLWPWKHMKGANVFMNDLMVRTFLLLIMAMINATFWIIVLPLAVTALLGRLLRTMREPDNLSTSSSDYEDDESAEDDEKD